LAAVAVPMQLRVELFEQPGRFYQVHVQSKLFFAVYITINVEQYFIV
jgi:hypothetical protein